MDDNLTMLLIKVGCTLLFVGMFVVPFWIIVMVRRFGEQDPQELFKGLRIHNLPTPETVEVNFKLYYGLFAGLRTFFYQRYLPPRDAAILMRRVQTLNFKRGAVFIAFPAIWLKSYVECQVELKSIEAQARRLRVAAARTP